MTDLFSEQRPALQQVYDNVYLLANFADTSKLLPAIEAIAVQAPFRQMMTPMGHFTRIALTNCGKLGWTSDQAGYRYSSLDPQTQTPWPDMPAEFYQLGANAASEAGFGEFQPDAALLNCYPVGGSMGAHQDKNEADFRWPIVSVSIGLAARFQIFGKSRSGRPTNVTLRDGDVMVWGGNSRLIYHGVSPVKADPLKPALKHRYNLTLRRAGQ